jgi:class 3 adenylate cyclase
VTIRIRVGLNSGEVVVRAIGSDLPMDYTAVGQTTHLAARMEQLADPGLANPTQRPELEKVLGRSLDWEGLREREAAMAPLLKEILGENGSLAAR